MKFAIRAVYRKNLFFIKFLRKYFFKENHLSTENVRTDSNLILIIALETRSETYNKICISIRSILSSNFRKNSPLYEFISPLKMNLEITV